MTESMQSTSKKAPAVSVVLVDDKEDDYVIAEYEDTFKNIDSKLDDIRTDFQREEEAKEQQDDDDETVSSVNLTSLQASLAEQSAEEMKKIVQGLNHQQEEEEKQETPATASVNNGDKATTSKSTSKQKGMVLYVLIPIALAILLGLKFSSSSTAQVSVELQNGAQLQPSRSVQYKETFRRKQCRYVNGQEYCESDEESRSSLTNDDGSSVSSGNAQQVPRQRQVYYQQKRERCQYVNGQKYCESYEQEHHHSAGTAHSQLP